jgi:hypothetical protein
VLATYQEHIPAHRIYKPIQLPEGFLGISQQVARRRDAAPSASEVKVIIEE